MNFWDILGISPSLDVNTIRKAYAQKVKQCHPEEHPQAFKELNEAYKRALAAVSRQTVFVSKRTHDADAQSEKDDFNDTGIQRSDNHSDAQADGFDFSGLKTDSNNHLNKSFYDVLEEMKSLIEQKTSRISVWKAYLRSERFAHVMENPRFIGELADLMRQYMSFYKPSLCSEIERIYFGDGRRNPLIPPYRQLSIMIEKCKSNNNRISTFKSFIYYYRAALYVLLILVFIIVVSVLSAGNKSSSSPPAHTIDINMFDQTITNPITPPPIITDRFDLPSALPNH